MTLAKISASVIHAMQLVEQDSKCKRMSGGCPHPSRSKTNAATTSAIRAHPVDQGASVRIRLRQKNRVPTHGTTTKQRGSPMAAKQLSLEEAKAHWAKTSTLMWTSMAIWFFLSFVVHIFARELNAITILGFPLGFWFVAQGSITGYVILCFWSSSAQNDIDREFGVEEE
jgi:putative solute:sodium symporter small subunit